MSRIDDDRSKSMNTKNKKVSRKANASKNKLKIPQTNQKTKEDITISHNLDAKELTTSLDCASEKKPLKILKSKPGTDNDGCKFINTKKKKCLRKKAPQIHQINQDTQEDITISDNLAAMTLTTSVDSASEEEEEDIKKAMKRAHHNDIEKERRNVERSAYKCLGDALSDATGETPKSRQEILIMGKEHITSERDTVIPNLAGRVAAKLRQNAALTRSEQILTSQLVNANQDIPELPPLPKSPERVPKTRKFLGELEHHNHNMAQMSHHSPGEAVAFARLKKLVQKVSHVETTSPEQDLLLANKYFDPKVKRSNKDKKELNKVYKLLSNYLADAKNK